MRECTDMDMQDLLPAFASDTLDEATRLTLEAHLAECAPCTADLALLRSVRAAMHRTPAVDVAAIVAVLPPSPALRRADGAPSLTVERGGAPRRATAPSRFFATRASTLRIAASLVAVALVGGLGVRVVTREEPARVEAVVASQPAAPDVPAPAGQVASSAPARGTASATVASNTPAVRTPPARGAGLTFGGGLADLSDEQLQALLDQVDDLNGVPSDEPELVLPGVEEG